MLSLEDATMLSRSTLATNDTKRVRDAGKGGGEGERGSEGGTVGRQRLGDVVLRRS